MHTRLKRFVLLVLTLALLFGAAGWCIPQLQTMRVKYDLTNEPAKGVTPELALATQALAWGRGIIIDVIWIRMEALKRDGRFFELVQLAKWACDLAPRIPQVWDVQAWNMAYNVSCQLDSFPDRWAWVWKAVALLRDEGIPANPNSAKLYESLAMTIYHKIGEQDDMAHPYYKQQFAYMMQEVLGGGGDEATLKAFVAAPQTREALLQDAGVRRLVTDCSQAGFDLVDGFFEVLFHTPSVSQKVIDLVNDPQNAAAMAQVGVFARARKLREVYKMDPALMLTLRDTYKDHQGRPAPFDWRSPYPHAIYWATVGLNRLDELSGRTYGAAKEFGFKVPKTSPRGPGDPYGSEDIYSFDRAQLSRIIYFSMQSLVTRGRVLFDSRGDIMLDFGADYRFTDAALPLYEKDIDNLDERYSNATKEGFQNFLINAVLQSYFTGDPAKAQEYYKILAARYPEVVKRYKSYDDFLEDQFRLYTSAMTFATARDLERSYITRAILALAVNEDDEAATFEKQAKELATRWVDLENNLRGMIRYDQIREEVIVDFLMGRFYLPPDVLANLEHRIGDDTVREIRLKVKNGEISAPTKENVDPRFLKDQTIKPIQNGPGQ